MTDTDAIDWKKELRKIEREFDGLPPEPTPQERRVRQATARREDERKQTIAATLGAWARLLLVVALGASLYWWPYARACSAGLVAFMSAEGMIVLGGLWVAACTWRWRLARTHAAAMLVVLCGIALLAAEVLPRVGYAKADPRHPPRWACEVR